MNLNTTNKRKIINDPVFGFISFQSDIIFDLIEHPYFQRLRRIKQLGLSNLVYPGTNHTRFEHTLGALHLTVNAIEVLRQKRVVITTEESEAVAIAILLHDIGHGPFSHALESTLVTGFSHEKMSLLLMEQLNLEFYGKLDLAIAIFKNEYHKHFLHQLISSQLDMDRLDYLRRDSFYTGVVEGAIGSDRIIKMLNVIDDQLVVDKKAIYSIEQFLIARRLMYWQVYLHKTVLAAEYMMINILKRAKELTSQGELLFGPPQLQWLLNEDFLEENLKIDDYKSILIKNFVALDDSDIVSSIKVWANHNDYILSSLSQSLINRKLFKIKISDRQFSKDKLTSLKEKLALHLPLSHNQLDYFVFQGNITNNAYEPESENIFILNNNKEKTDLSKASDIDLAALSKTVRKHFLCYPKELVVK